MTKLTVRDIAERLSIAEQTAQMMFDTGIIEGACLKEGWACVEKAYITYLKGRKPRTERDIYEVTQRFMTSCDTARHGLYDLDLLIAERDIPAERADAAQYFREKVHELIDDMTNIIDLGNEAIQEAQRRMPH